jgi:integrase
MSLLVTAAEEYLALRRSLGFKLTDVGRTLLAFVHFAEREGAEWITTDLALRWATQPASASPAHWARRLGIVRQFARHCSALDARTEIPPPQLLPYRYVRRSPHIYRDEEVLALIEAAGRLPSASGLRAATYAALFGLLAVTGMRVGEPVGLDRTDVDLEHGSLSIRGAKFGKSRWLPLHASTTAALKRYAEQRDSLYPTPSTPSFFLSEQGTRLTTWSVRATFVKLSHRIGLRAPGDHHGPRLHDLRHRFAIRTLLDWYRSGVDVERRLPQLAAYLGHAHVADTYWYLSATPELLALAAQRVEAERIGEEQS